MKILQIETATSTCSVALAIDGKTTVLKEENAPNIHAAYLTLFIDEVMKNAGCAYVDLDAIAVSKGPGSYTGLRIGVSTAKGLCFALDKPLLAIDTLSMMASGFLSAHPNYGGLICPMIDARRMEVFTAVYTNKLQVYETVNAKIVDEKSFILELDKNYVTFIGDGAAKCIPVLEHQNAHFSSGNYNSAANMSILAKSAFTQQKFEDVAYFEPFYLKDFVFTTPKMKG